MEEQQKLKQLFSYVDLIRVYEYLEHSRRKLGKEEGFLFSIWKNYSRSINIA